VVRLAADHNLRKSIVDGLLRRKLDLDIVSIAEVGLAKAPDAAILEWAAREGRVLLTHDVSTVPDFAYDRLTLGQPMAGVVVVGNKLPTGRAIDELLLLLECSGEDEWESRVTYLPL
jgi:predicted nuclease of predicted toxin-antitoxin system